MISPHSTKARRRGAAAVEFAVVLPLLLVLLLGMWEFGRIIDVQQTLSTAAREAGREASTGNYNHDQIITFARNALARAGLSTEAVNAAAITVTNQTSAKDARQADQLDHFTIALSLTYGDVRWSPIDLIVGPSAALTATADWYSMRDVPLEVNPNIPLN